MRASINQFIDEKSAYDLYAIEDFILNNSRPALLIPAESVDSGGHDILIDIDTLRLLQDALADFGSLILPGISDMRSKIITADYSREDSLDIIVAISDRSSGAPFTTQGVIRLTPPSTDNLFPDMDDVNVENTAYWDSVTNYETWMQEYRDRSGIDKRFRMQVGGWCQFIQSGSDDEHIALFDANTGDSSVLYLSRTDRPVESPEGFLANLQMC
jgi:hypothetical protein